MKISLIIPSFYPAVIYGGPIFSTLYTCQELSRIPNTQIFVSTTNANMTTWLDQPRNKWTVFQKNFSIKYYHDTFLNKLSIPLLIHLWKDIYQSDCVHIQAIFSSSTPIALLYAKLFHKPVLLSPRGSLGGWCLGNGNTFKQKWLDWFIKPFANSIIWHATADQERDEIRSIFPDAHVTVIPNGIEYETFQHSNPLTAQEFTTKFAHTTASTDKIIVSMGRLQKKKGFDILIDAFALLLEHYSDAKLFIAGADEGEEQNLRSQIERLGLEQKAFLVGAISGQDKIDFLANADLFVLPSHNENFGNVYLESLATGTPIVASLDTPWSEVESAGCGRWVANTPNDTAEAMFDILSRDRQQSRIASKNLAKNYGWDSIAHRFHALYRQMLES